MSPPPTDTTFGMSMHFSQLETIVQKSLCWLLKRWNIYRVIDQNIQRLLFSAVFASYIASILNYVSNSRQVLRTRSRQHNRRPIRTHWLVMWNQVMSALFNLKHKGEHSIVMVKIICMNPFKFLLEFLKIKCQCLVDYGSGFMFKLVVKLVYNRKIDHRKLSTWLSMMNSLKKIMYTSFTKKACSHVDLRGKLFVLIPFNIHVYSLNSVFRLCH